MSGAGAEMRPGLTVVSAGAGSGKTHRLCEEISRWVAAGRSPEKILATTFTVKAAAELKGRAQGWILRDESHSRAQRVELAERLELAAIGTVHSVGLQLLQRHALALGLAPDLQTLEETSRERHLRRLLSELPPGPWDDLHEIAGRLARNDLDDLALALLQEKRTNRITDEDFRAQLAAGAEEVCDLLHPEADELLDGGPEVLRPLLREALEGMLALEECEHGNTQKALDLLRWMLAARDERWRAFRDAGKISACKTHGAHELLEEVHEIAGSVRRRRGLHQDCRELARLLAERVVTLEGVYESYKAERGLLDFTDMEVGFLRILEEPSLREELARDVELVLVDEFQDTNPIQLAIFLRLEEIAERSVWVGDPKQSIYGFRGADARLVVEAWDRVPDEARKNLPRNYRSQAGLVTLTGRLFESSFGEEVHLEPVHDPRPGGLHRWLLEARNNTQEAACLAEGIRDLSRDGRRLREIAVLVRTHDRAKDLAEALVARGVPAVLKRPGLLASRECAVALAALRLVADRRDGLAAATILHLLGDPSEETPGWLEERLRWVEEDRRIRHGEEEDPRSREEKVPWPGHELLRPLEAIDPRGQEPAGTLLEVIEALDLVGRAAAWGEPARRAAHLDALVDLAEEFQGQARGLGASATLAGLISHLEGLAEDQEDEHPVPRGVDAVNVLTYHAAKGLQWPVVVLANLDKEYDARLWEPRAEGGRASEGRPLEDRRLQFWAWPFGGLSKVEGVREDAEATDRGRREAAAEIEEARRLLYVGFTRAQEQVVLAHRPGRYAWLENLEGVDEVLPPDLPEGEHDLDGCSTTLVVRTIEASDAEASGENGPGGEAAEEQDPRSELWIPVPEARPGKHPARRRSPSGAEPEGPAPQTIEVVTLEGEGLPPRAVEAEDLVGNAVHLYLAALPSLASADRGRREAVARRTIEGYGLDDEIDPARLVAAGERFERWVGQRWPEADWRVEVPLDGERAEGGRWVGTADLLLVGPEGTAVLVDHKSAPVTSEAAAREIAARHVGQLAAYGEALASAGLEIAEAWIHLPAGGFAARLELPLQA